MPPAKALSNDHRGAADSSDLCMQVTGWER